MNMPYLLRLLCLSLACFFLVHLALGLGVSLMASAALRLAERIRARWASDLLLMLRLLPSALAVAVVAGICVPSYLWLEPEAPFEHVGMLCLGAALASVAIWGISVGRGLRALARSVRYIRACHRAGWNTRLAGEQLPVSVVDGAPGMLALAGIIHPRLIVSREVMNELSAEQLAAALRHERAHRTSGDNLKRLLLLCAPDILPFGFRFLGGYRVLEGGWVRFAEWAADDGAVAGDSRYRISLAAALVRVARMGAAAPPSLLMTSLVAEGRDLEARVERLLGQAPGGENPAPIRTVLAAATLLLAGFLAAVWMTPATLHGAHRLLEHLIG
jgi:hypothetical protein